MDLNTDFSCLYEIYCWTWILPACLFFFPQGFLVGGNYMLSISIVLDLSFPPRLTPLPFFVQCSSSNFTILNQKL